MLLKHPFLKIVLLVTVVLCAQSDLLADESTMSKQSRPDKFRQLEEILPTPNDFRTASGSPGKGYWQQRADYKIDVEVDDKNQRIIGKETITYKNFSPDVLKYIWVQLDQNILEKKSDANLAATAPSFKELPYKTLYSLIAQEQFDGGFKIKSAQYADGKKLNYTVAKTMMRIDLVEPLKSGAEVSFTLGWEYAINDAMAIRTRSGYEYFEKDKNYIYEIAQWFPRLAAYTDVTGWQHKQFIGSGEFTLELGDYEVRITVPADHIVASTGVLQNPKEVLNNTQRNRLKKAKTSKKPLYIVTPAEALANEKKRNKNKKTWVFHAGNVRDFAFASSRKFIWDAQGHSVEGNKVMAMSFYPNEAEPLWSQYSTHAIIHTLNVYSRYSFRYPYPVALSVNGPVGGMEYPMISFNQPRPDKDKTYWGKADRDKKNYQPWEHSKYGLISVVIHEVGHNYFPMIVNSDERQWTWMDEGLNSFLQFLAEQEWEENYPSRRGFPKDIVEYMRSTEQVPIMTNSESILQFGNNAYGKPAMALNILRETIMGRDLFDFAFKEYSQRWMFKRPMPADFFRTMEDASGIDLDWFWRGWFYTTDHTDIAIENVRLYELDTQNPEIEKPKQKKSKDEEAKHPTTVRNEGMQRRLGQFSELKDFYNRYNEYAVTKKDKKKFRELISSLEAEEKSVLKTKYMFYVVDFVNLGGLVMPIILDIEYMNGSKERMNIPAEIWSRNSEKVSKLILTKKEIKNIILDPQLETADINTDNNYYPSRPIKSRFQLYKQKEQPNPMQNK